MGHPKRWWGPAAAALLLSCGGDDPVRPRPEEVLTVRIESARGVYYHAPGDRVDVQAQELYYDWLLPRLGIEPQQPLVLFKYRDRAHMRSVTGQDTNGWAEEDNYRFHTIWPWDNHECVHALVSATLGTAPALFNEGIAVAHQAEPAVGIVEPVWSGTPIDTVASRLRAEDRIPGLSEVLRSADFRRFDTGITYPVAGSFMRSLLQRHGYEDVKTFLRTSDSDDGSEQIHADFRGAFGEEVEHAWQVWLTGLGG